MHGTKECPKEFFKFVKKNKIKKVALELPKDYQCEIDEFYSGKRKIDDLSFFKCKEKNHDGRVSNAMKDLILKLKKAKIKIFLVDDETQEYGNERDKLMARNLSQLKGEVAFLCGNVHAMKKPLQLDKSDRCYHQYPNGKVETCGSFMNPKEIVSIKVHAINGGKLYNYSVQTYLKDKERSKKFPKNKLPEMIKSDDESFDYLYLIDKFSYSK